MPETPSSTHASGPSPTLCLIGGFLGAGKTTFISRATRLLQGRGLRGAIVGNDQSTGLVDTASARSLDGAAVGEITGACFCCKLDELVSVVEGLRDRERPDVILCEPVGSCTDLIATVVRPLEQVYQTGFRIAPFTVLLDARRALSAYGGHARRRDFTKDVGYVFRKQVEEAEVLFINKVEKLADADREKLLRTLAMEFPHKEIRAGSAKDGEGVAEWLDGSLGKAPAIKRPPLEIDYTTYAHGEALLGWYNARLDWDPPAPTDADQWLLETAIVIADALEAGKFEVAHFKMSLRPEQGGLAVVNQVLSGEAPVLSRSLGRTPGPAELLVNLRAEGDASDLRKIVREALQASAVPLAWHEESAFQPGEPKPTHRIAIA